MALHNRASWAVAVYLRHVRLVSLPLLLVVGLWALRTGGGDAHTYFAAGLEDTYRSPLMGVHGAFYYSPAFAQLVALFAWLPWPVFHAIFLGGLLALLAWLAGPLLPLALLFGPVQTELWFANVNLVLAAVVVAGFRRPWLYAFVLLSKVTPAVVLLWFVARRDWRSLGIALGTTAAVVAVSVALAPGLWAEWIAVLRMNAGAPLHTQISMPVALAVALGGVLALVGGLLGWRWPVLLAAMTANPNLSPEHLCMLAGLPRAIGRHRAPRATQAGSASV